MSTDLSEEPLSPWWRLAVVIVMAFGFSLLTLVTVLTCTHAPPIPDRVPETAGATLFTGDDVEHGQVVPAVAILLLGSRKSGETAA